MGFQLYSQSPPNLTIELYAGLTITGTTGGLYTIQYTGDPSRTDGWIALTTILLPSSPYLWVDTTDPATGKRFYRAVEGATNLVWMRPGTFTMGSPTNEDDHRVSEGPQTVVTLTKGFYIGRYPVTQAEYLAVTGSNPSAFSQTGGYADGPNRPVEMVSWLDAKAYCASLTKHEQAAGRLPVGWVYRLPAEAEWEYACRAGTTTRYSYGDDPNYTSLTYYAWYGANSASQTHQVGLKSPNPWGLFDMQGNVAEMCQDWFGPYSGGTVTDPHGPPSGSAVVLRNCGWACVDPTTLRSAFRNNWNAWTVGLNWVGFRIVLAPG